MELRKHARFELNLEITLGFRGQIVSGRLRDLSRGGLFVNTTSQLDIEFGQPVLVEFGFQTADIRCVAQGMVVRSEKHGFGVQFEEISDEFNTFVDDLERLGDPIRLDFLESVLEPFIRLD